MKILLSILLLLFNIKYSFAEIYGDLLWDYDKHKVERKINCAMDYVKDLNERIDISLGKGNIARANHLSELLSTLISTGKPFGLSDRAATNQELRTINASAILILKARFEYTNWRFQDENGDSKKERFIDQVKWLFPSDEAPFLPRLDPMVKQQIKHFTSLMRAHWHSSEIGKINSIFSEANEDVKSLITPQDKSYATKVFSQKLTLGKTDWYRKDQRGNIIITDLAKDQEFYLQKTAAGSCFFAAVEKNNSYRAVDFAKELKDLNIEKRRLVIVFMENFYRQELIKNKKGKEFSELFKKAKFDFSSDSSMNKESIDYLIRPENFSRLIDFHLNTNICWLPAAQGHSAYSSLYAHIKKKNIFTLHFYPLKDGSFFSDYFACRVDKSLEAIFMIFNSGDIHFSGLIPLQQEEKFKSTPLADEKYLKTWHTPS